MTYPPTRPARRIGDPFVCRECGGPCFSFKGTTHGWTCAACLRMRLAEQDDRYRERIADEYRGEPLSATERRRRAVSS